METITLKAGESPLLKAIEYAEAAAKCRSQGNTVMADSYQSMANYLMRVVIAMSSS